MSNLSRIEFDATPEERNRLNMEAAAHGMSRKELIRERVLYPQRVASLGNGRDCSRDYAGSHPWEIDDQFCNVAVCGDHD